MNHPAGHVPQPQPQPQPSEPSEPEPTAPPIEKERGPRHPIKEPGPAQPPERV